MTVAAQEIMILRVPALRRHFANTFSSDGLFPWFTLHLGVDLLLLCDCGRRPALMHAGVKYSR